MKAIKLAYMHMYMFCAFTSYASSSSHMLNIEEQKIHLKNRHFVFLWLSAAKTNLFEKTGTVVKECHGFSEVSKPQDQLSKRIRLTGNVIVIADKLFEVNTILQRPGSSEGYIIIKFDKLYLCNELKLNVQSGTNWDYDVSVSSDSTSWNSVVHYEKFQCCSFQQLYFPTQAAR